MQDGKISFYAPIPEHQMTTTTDTISQNTKARQVRIIAYMKYLVRYVFPSLIRQFMYVFPQLGQEEAAVLRILKAFINWNPATECPVRSAIARSCLPGRIFIEAASYQVAINMAIQFDVLKQNEVKILPIEEAHLCLLGGTHQYTPSVYSWVRLRKRPYQSDVAFIRGVDLRSLRIHVVLVPRLSYGQTVKRKRGNRPAQRLLNSDDIIEKCGHKAIVKRNFRWIYKGDSYSENGYLFLPEIDTTLYSPKYCLPTAVELDMFEECEEVPAHVLVDTATKIAALTLRPGDRIQILTGDCIGLSGELCTRTENEADVYVPVQDVVISLPLTDLQCHFKQGDNVEVIAGLHKGLIGFVVTCFEQSLSLYIPDTVEEVNIFRIYVCLLTDALSNRLKSAAGGWYSDLRRCSE